METELIYTIAVLLSLVIVWLINRYTGHRISTPVRKLITTLLSTLLRGAIGQDKSKMPDPPTTTQHITGKSLKENFAPYGIDIGYVAEDRAYELPTKADVQRFINWYVENAPIKPADYTADAFDCGDFAWTMRAYYLMWSKGKCPIAYIEAERQEPGLSFRNHAFCGVMTGRYEIYYIDPLGIAADFTRMAPAYTVKCYWARA